MLPYVNIHTHRPTGSGIELRTAGVHPWDAATQDAATLGQRLGGAQAVGETGLISCEAPTVRPSCPHCGRSCGWPASGDFPWCSTASGPSSR